jgi:hypothetical protein
VAEANGYSSGYWMAKCLLGVTSVANISDDDVQGFSYLLGLEMDEVVRLAYIPAEKHRDKNVLYFGQPINLRYMKTTISALCPLCLEGVQATNGFWELQYACVCPFHGSLLIDTCQQCARPVSWHRGKVCECKCGFDYRSSKVQQADPIVVELAKAIYARANLSLIEASQASKFGLPLKLLHAESLSGLLGMIYGLRVLDEQRRHDYVFLPSTSNRIRQEYWMMEHTSHLLNDWPENFLNSFSHDCERMKSARGNACERRMLGSLLIYSTLTKSYMPEFLKQAGACIVKSYGQYDWRDSVSEAVMRDVRIAIGASACY